MRMFHGVVARALVAGALITAGAVIGCEREGTRGAPASTAHVERDVKSLLERWVHTFEKRDLNGVRSVLAADDRFVWLEDGEPRYRGADEVVRALAGFPPGLAFTHELRDVLVTPISEDAAWAHMAASTRIKQNGQVVSEFGSVVLMVVRRENGVWRISAAHTSTTKPRGTPAG